MNDTIPEDPLNRIETIARGICMDKGRILLCRPKGGAYAYLPGGHIEFGETGREALVREVREELGVASQAGSFRGIVESVFEQKGRTHAEISTVYELTLDAPLDEPKAQEAWIEFVWCPLDQLDEVNLLPAEFRVLKTHPEAMFG